MDPFGVQNVVGDYKSLLSNSGILTVALGTILAKAFGLLVEGLIDDIISPTIAPVLNQVTSRTGGVEFTLFGITLKLGSFLNTVIKFMLYVVGIVFTLNLFAIELTG